MMGNDIMVAPSIFVEMILSPIDSYVPYSIGRVLCVEREFRLWLKQQQLESWEPSPALNVSI